MFMNRLLILLVFIFLASGLLPGRAAPAGFAPDVAKYQKTVSPNLRGYVAAFPLIVLKNLASMHQIQSLSVDVSSSAPGALGTDKPDSTFHVDWQKPDKVRIQQYRDGALIGEQVVDGTYHWQWFARFPTPQNPIPPRQYQYMKSDFRPANFPKGAVLNYSDIGSIYDPSVGIICRPDGLFVAGATDMGKVSASGPATVHRISILVGKQDVRDPKNGQVTGVDITQIYDLDPINGLPLQVTTTNQQSLVYSHYRINPALTPDTFTVQNPDQYVYFPSPALPIRPGETAPAFTLIDADGKLRSSSDFQGKPLLLCFVQTGYSRPGDLAEALEQLKHYIDVKSVTVALVGGRLPIDRNRPPAYLKRFTDWLAAHPFLSKLWLVETGKGFGDKIQAQVMNRYGINNEGTVLIGKDGKVAATFTMTYNTGKPLLQSVGKTEAEDTYLKGFSSVNTTIAADIAAITALAAP